MKFDEAKRTLLVKAKMENQHLVTPANAHDELLAEKIIESWQHPLQVDDITYDINHYLDVAFTFHFS